VNSRSVQKFRSLLTDPHQLRKAAIAFGGAVATTSLLVTSGVVVLRQIGVWQGAELSAYDRLMRLRPAESVDDRLLVVGISEADIQSRQEYPLEDGTLAELLEKLNAAQPRAIGIDIARDVPQGEGRTALIQQLEGSDRVVGACLLSSTNDPGLPPPPGVSPERIGFADLPQDLDGMIRRSILVSTPAPSEAPLPTHHVCNQVNPENQLVSLSFALALLYLAPENIQAEQTADGEIQVGSVVLHPLSQQAGGYHQTDATDYQVMLNYRNPRTIRQISLTEALSGQFEPDWVKDRVVLIGYTSEVAKDVFYTPFSGGEADDRTMPGVVVHAQSTSQILSAVFDQRPLIWYWAQGWELLWILGWSIVGGVIAWCVRRPWRFVLLEGLALGALFGACYLLFLHGGWIPLVPPAIALVLTAGGVILVDRAHEGGYTQAIYEQAKDQIQSILQPKIEIDQEKKAQQVAEITETSYFKDLAQRAKEIREQRNSTAKRRPSAPTDSEQSL
jgi:adenylate cyclase